MLVLSRKVGERIVIDDNITLVVNRIAGNRVSIGIDAPSDVKIVRGELEPIANEFAESEQLQPAAAPIVFDTNATSYIPRSAR